MANVGNNRVNILHMLVASGDSENNKQVLDKVLKHPEGQHLLSLKDGNVYTATQAAAYYNYTKISDMLFD